MPTTCVPSMRSPRTDPSWSLRLVRLCESSSGTCPLSGKMQPAASKISGTISRRSKSAIGTGVSVDTVASTVRSLRTGRSSRRRFPPHEPGGLARSKGSRFHRRCVQYPRSSVVRDCRAWQCTFLADVSRTQLGAIGLQKSSRRFFATVCRSTVIREKLGGRVPFHHLHLWANDYHHDSRNAFCFCVPEKKKKQPGSGQAARTSSSPTRPVASGTTSTVEIL